DERKGLPGHANGRPGSEDSVCWSIGRIGNRSHRMVPRRARPLAYTAGRYQLWICRSAHDLRYYWRKSLDLQGRGPDRRGRATESHVGRLRAWSLFTVRLQDARTEKSKIP